MKSFVFDIETRINKEMVRDVVYEGRGLSPEQAYLSYKQELLDQSNGKSDFMPVIFHEPISICYVLCDNYKIQKVGALPHGDDGVVKFWDAVNKDYRIVSWNGRTFDLPVMELAAIRLGIPAPAYYNAKFGARNRYSDQGHYDLFDFATNYGAAYFRGGLNAISKMIGLPGKVGAVRGNEVQKAYEDGRLDAIEHYCLGDTLNTYGIWIHIDYLRGRLDRDEYDQCRADCLQRLEALDA